MPLQKDKALPNGVTGNYWKVTEFTFNARTHELQVKIELFLSSTIANSTMRSLGMAKRYLFTIDPNSDASLNTLRTQIYVLILAKASSIISVDQFGRPQEPAPFDADLADASIVA